MEKGGSPNESVSGFQARSRTIRFLPRDSRRRGIRHLANALSAGASARRPTISPSTNHDRALIVVVAIPFVTDLSPDFATGKHCRVDIGVPQVDAQNPHEAGEVARRDVLRRHGQDVGRGPRAGDRAAMPGSVRARGPTSPAAEEHDHRASILRATAARTDFRLRFILIFASSVRFECRDTEQIRSERCAQFLFGESAGNLTSIIPTKLLRGKLTLASEPVVGLLTPIIGRARPLRPIWY